MLRVPHPPFRSTERLTILKQLQNTRTDLSELRFRLLENDEDRTLLREETVLVEQLLSLRDLYRRGTVILPLSRCPFTGLVIYYSIDIDGFDGPWWDYDDPVREHQRFPPTVIALTGAVQLSKPIERTDHLVFPGPGAPYVIPRILERKGTIAVLSGISIGKHQAFAMVYFRSRLDATYPVVDEWGRQGWLKAEDEPPSWDDYMPGEDDLDFAIQPWIESNRLLWIQPGDFNVKLNAGLKGCPYLDLSGPRQLQRLYQGRLS